MMNVGFMRGQVVVTQNPNLALTEMEKMRILNNNTQLAPNLQNSLVVHESQEGYYNEDDVDLQVNS